MNRWSKFWVHLHEDHEEPFVPALDEKATKILLLSLIGLIITATIQMIIFTYSGSRALLADTIHNYTDAFTSVPLWLAFVLSRRLPTKRFSYGFNRSEDIAGLFIILVISASTIVAGYASIQGLIYGEVMTHVTMVSLAAIVGFVGNEIVALFRLSMGRKIGSAALVADGQHARLDGFTSLAILLGVVGTWLGYPQVDSIVGLLITATMVFIVIKMSYTMITRIMDGVEPKMIDQISSSAETVPGVVRVKDVKARWFGHDVLAELSIVVNSNISVKDGHEIACKVMEQVQTQVQRLTSLQVHVDPLEMQGHQYHISQAMISPILKPSEEETPVMMRERPR